MSAIGQWIRKVLDAVVATTNQPDPSQRCPNCQTPLMRWTESAWQNGEFFTRYWQGCPNWRTAMDRLDFSTARMHKADWRRTSWGTRVLPKPDRSEGE